MISPILSICIPTFNREIYLKECLDSLQRSWIPGVEIVVSDNASTDNTIALLEKYANQLPIRWQRQLSNVGFDRNCAAVVSMAYGKYCWILGSDDVIMPDALRKAVDWISRQEIDIFHFGYVQADLYLRPLSCAAPPKSDDAYVWNHSEVQKYLGALSNISLAFAFISCFIFRRERWISQLDRIPAWLDSHYVHAYMLHAMLATGASVISSDDYLVIARGGNQNEWNVNPAKFLQLDAITLLRIHREIYRDAAYLEALGRIFRRSYTMNSILSMASRGYFPQLIFCQKEIVALGYSHYLIQFLKLVEWFCLMPALAGLIALRRYFLNTFKYIRAKFSK